MWLALTPDQSAFGYSDRAEIRRSSWATHLAVRAKMWRIVERAAALGIIDEHRHGGQLLPPATRDPPEVLHLPSGYAIAHALKCDAGAPAGNIWCRRASWGSLNQIVCALRFFYGVTLDRAEIPERIVYARMPRKLPTILSVDPAAVVAQGTIADAFNSYLSKAKPPCPSDILRIGKLNERIGELSLREPKQAWEQFRRAYLIHHAPAGQDGYRSVFQAAINTYRNYMTYRHSGSREFRSIMNGYAF